MNILEKGWEIAEFMVRVSVGVAISLFFIGIGIREILDILRKDK